MIGFALELYGHYGRRRRRGSRARVPVAVGGRGRRGRPRAGARRLVALPRAVPALRARVLPRAPAGAGERSLARARARRAVRHLDGRATTRCSRTSCVSVRASDRRGRTRSCGRPRAATPDIDTEAEELV
jgi:hypothetical protein